MRLDVVVCGHWQEAEEKRLKEEQEQREHEEYLKMKEAFTVDEEGTDAVEEQDVNMLCVTPHGDFLVCTVSVLIMYNNDI